MSARVLYLRESQRHAARIEANRNRVRYMREATARRYAHRQAELSASVWLAVAGVAGAIAILILGFTFAGMP